MGKSEPRIISGWRWLGRVALVGTILTFIMVAAWCFWSWEVTRRCDAFIADLRAEGKMVSWDELKVEDVPDAQNAAYYLKQASALLRLPARTPTTRDPVVGSPAWLATAKANVAANGASLALIRQARGCSRVCWAPKPASGPPMPTFANMTSTSKLVRDAALPEHVNGNDAQAVEYWRDIEAQIRILDSGPVMLIQGLIAVIVDQIGMDTMEAIVPDIDIGGPGGISSDDARRLIAELLDDGASRDALARGFSGERTCSSDVYLKGPHSSVAPPMRPLVNSEMLVGWRTDESASRDVRELRVSAGRDIDDYDRLIGIIPQFTYVSKDTVHLALRRRVSAMALAIRLYHHELGRYPENPDQMVPGFLKSIPVDPSASDGRVLGYLLLADGRRPMIYSAPKARPPSEIVAQLPKLRSTMGTQFLGPAAVGYFDASAWIADPIP